MRNNSTSLYQKLRAVRQDEKGFSLLELMIAMVIFLIVTGSIYGVLRVAQQSRSVVNEQVQLTKNVRLALNIVGRDTYNAGYGYPLENTVVLPDNRIGILLGIPVDSDNSRDTVPPIIAGNNITLNNLGGVAGALTDQVTFLFKDTTFNKVGPANSTDERLKVSQPLSINAATTTDGIDEIVPISGSNSVCRVNDIYLITGNTGSTLALATALSGTNKIQFSNGDVLGFNQTGTSGPLRGITTPASLLRVKLVTYFVTTDGILTRRDYANVPPVSPAVGFADEPLVYGVDNFQIQYVLDDGSLTDNPNQANLEAVRQIKFTVSVRSTELNAAGQPYRATMTTTYSTRNLGYDAS